MAKHFTIKYQIDIILYNNMSKQAKILVTTSWDDGDKLDLKLAALLEKYGIKGTFYVTKNYQPGGLTAKDILSLSRKFEIGSHTLSHPRLEQATLAVAAAEIKESKKYLEGLLGRKIKMFAYPWGRCNTILKKLVEEAGYLGARTSLAHDFSRPRDRFAFNLTLCVCPFPGSSLAGRFRKKDSRFSSVKIGRSLYYNFYQFKKGLITPSSLFCWRRMAINYFDQVCRRGEVFHLSGHSWEIDRYDLWEELEIFFQYLSESKMAKFLTNAQMLEHFFYE